MGNIYTIINLRTGKSCNLRDKKTACKILGMSAPTFEKYLVEGGYFLSGDSVVSCGKLEKSSRGINISSGNNFKQE